ncbi:MAG: ABC transporter permease [Planctomycetota bacterium]|jgi:oligopeptide transport system permease protein
MGTLIPFEFADLGPAEFAWLLLAFGGLSLLAPPVARGRTAAITAAILAAVGFVRHYTLPAGATGWDTWGPVFVVPAAVAALLYLGCMRLSRGDGLAWLGALVAVSLLARPFGLRPLGDWAEWCFLALLGFALAAVVEEGGSVRRLLRARRGRLRLWMAAAIAFFLLVLFAQPFGMSWIGAVALLFLAWLVHAVIDQGLEMRRYVLRRLGGAPIVLLTLLALSFFIMRLAPGGPFDKDKRVDPEVKSLIEAKYGLDEPLPKQFAEFVSRLVWVGDLGPSFKQKGFTVNEIIARHIGASARLGLAAITLAILVGVTAGLISGIRQNSIFDYASMTGAMLGLALPTFVVGPMLVLLFAMKLDWFHVTGWEDFPRDLILPAVTLSLPFAARIARLTRAGMLEIVNQDYIRTARAKGLSEPVIVLRHTLKGTLLPVISFLGPGIAQLLTGSLVVEMIFGVPGMGKEFVQSALNRDYGLAMGLVLIYGSLLIVFNLIVDVMYAFLDPRIRHG